MRFLLIGIIAFLGWSAGATWWYSCRIKGACMGIHASPKDTLGEIPPLNQAFDAATGRFVLPEGGLPVIRTDSLSWEIVGSPEWEQLLSEIKQQTATHPDKAILLSMGAREDGAIPMDSVEFRGRLDALRSALLAGGIPADRILMDLKAIDPWQSGIAPGSFAISLADSLQVQTKEQEALPADSVTKPEPTTEPGPDPAMDGTLPASLTGIQRIYFSYARPLIAGGGKDLSLIREAVAFLKQNPGWKVLLTGYTDDSAAKGPNYQLGLKRAQKVRDLFLNEGAGEEQVEVASGGESNPLASNNTEAGRQKNRRVEIEFKAP